MYYIVLYKKKCHQSESFPWQEHCLSASDTVDFINGLGDNYITKVLKEISYETLCQIADGDIEE